MKKTLSIILGGLALTPLSASAQLANSSDGGPFGVLLVNIVVLINDILIPFIIAMGFLAFVWGMFKYFILGGSDDDKKAQGRSLMVNATIGFVVIIIFFGIVNMITTSTGLDGEIIENVPTLQLPNP